MTVVYTNLLLYIIFTMIYYVRQEYFCKRFSSISYIGRISGSQGAANQFEMWLGQSLFVLVLYKGKTTKLGLSRGFQKTFNK